MSEDSWSPKDNSGNNAEEPKGEIVPANNTIEPVESAQDSAKSDENAAIESLYADNTSQSANDEAQQTAQQSQQTYAPVDATVIGVEPIYEEGCCGAAWQDMRASKGWFGKLALMALIEFVPILNWVNKGYSLRWGRELIFSKVNDMPQKIFGNRHFVTGAMNFLIMLVLVFVLTILCVCLEIIPILGWVASFFLGIFGTMVIYMCRTRMAIFDELSEGFSISKGYRAGKGHWAKLFCASFVPQIICDLIKYAIVTLLFVVFVLIFAVDFGTDFVNLVNQYGGIDNYSIYLENSSETQWQLIMLIITACLAGLPLVLIGWYFVNMCNVASTILTCRACGHYAARYCGEWREDPRFATLAQE